MPYGHGPIEAWTLNTHTTGFRKSPPCPTGMAPLKRDDVHGLKPTLRSEEFETSEKRLAQLNAHRTREVYDGEEFLDAERR